MKNILSSGKLFALCFVIILATNLIVILGIISNRSGQPETIITLTERELSLPYHNSKENSELSLKLNWRVLNNDKNNSKWSSPAWFNTEKLKALGVKNIQSRQPIAKQVFIVLEYNGNQYNETVKKAEIELNTTKAANKQSDKNQLIKYANQNLKYEQNAAPRLYAVDAGLNPEILRKKYKDTRYIIARGVVKPNHLYRKNKKETYGMIHKLVIENIHVPLKHRKVFDTIISQKEEKNRREAPPRYEVKLAYGKQLEPWIMSVHAL